MNPAERKALKARAHALDPIVRLGEKGLTDAVIAEIGRALAAHALAVYSVPRMPAGAAAVLHQHWGVTERFANFRSEEKGREGKIRRKKTSTPTSYS